MANSDPLLDPIDSTSALALILFSLSKGDTDIARSRFDDLVTRIEAGFPPDIKRACQRAIDGL